MRYFLFEGLQYLKLPAHVTLGGSDARHIKNVLRLGSGDHLGIFDGAGGGYEARITELTSTGVEVMVTAKCAEKSAPKIHLEILQALLKDRKMDGMVRQLTELGVSRFVPFISSRSIPKLDKKRIHARTQRWEKITKESLKQCRRGYTMEIQDVIPFQTMLDHVAHSDLALVFWEEATTLIPSIIDTVNTTAVKRIAAILGPEGGFTPEEIKMAEAAGCSTVSLGPRILRAETAAISVSALLQYLFGDMG